jgi:hypothetical protein
MVKDSRGKKRAEIGLISPTLQPGVLGAADDVSRAFGGFRKAQNRFRIDDAEDYGRVRRSQNLGRLHGCQRLKNRLYGTWMDAVLRLFYQI